MKDKESRALQSINETLAQKAAKRRKLNKEVEDLKIHLEIVPGEDDDVYTKATPLARKVPVVDYEIIHLNNKLHYKIIRADGTHQLFVSFLTLLKNFGREDLESLWSLVKERWIGSSLEESKDCTWSSKELSAAKQKIMLLDNAAEGILMLLSQVKTVNDMCFYRNKNEEITKYLLLLEVMAVTTLNTNNTTIKSILLAKKLTHLNFTNWYQNLRIVLEYEKKIKFVERPANPPDPETSNPNTIDKYYKTINLEQEAKHELFKTVKAFYTCKQEEGLSVSFYLLKLKSYLDELERLGYAMPNELGLSLILNSLNKNYDQFIQNYNVHNIGKTIAKLHAMLKLHEKGTPKKAETLVVLAIREGKIQKDKQKLQGAKGKDKGKNKLAYPPKPKILPSLKRDNLAKDSVYHQCKEGLRGCKKLKHRALSLYVGKGMRAAVEAIGSFDLVLPSGLIIVAFGHYRDALPIVIYIVDCSFTQDLFGINIPVRVSHAHCASLPDNERMPCRIWDVAGNNVAPLRSDTIRLVQNGCLFHGVRYEDPNQHLKDFLKLVDSIDLDGSITTWEDLTTNFLAQFFPPGRTAKLCNDILLFQQHQGESLSEAWTRFKDLL
uniref:Retrotransposon gag domain-containing protein n=1 Tax=Tanacetum cinerariifolium TaxID=118510 RepID=A0A6L2MXX4_TANCI|nr:hypothetical protein [Tanacetum cinerariifolium]